MWLVSPPFQGTAPLLLPGTWVEGIDFDPWGMSSPWCGCEIGWI